MGKADYAVAEESLAGEKLAGENGNGDVKSFNMEEEQGTYSFHVYIDTSFVIMFFYLMVGLSPFSETLNTCTEVPMNMTDCISCVRLSCSPWKGITAT